MKKCLFVLIISVFAVFALSASQKLYDAASYEYRTVRQLCLMSGVNGPSSVTPVTENELKTALDRIRTDKLPAGVIEEYQNIRELLFAMNEEFSMDFGVNISPQVFIAENYDAEDRNYFFMPYSEEKPSVELGGRFGFGNNAFIEGYLPIINSPISKGMFKQSFAWLINHKDGKWNINGTNATGMNAEVPFLVRGAIGNEWVNLVLGRTHHSIGTGYTGNLIIGDNFAYQEVMKLGFFSRNFNYNISYTHFDTQNGLLWFDTESFSGKNQIRIDHRFDIGITDTFLLSADLCTLYFADSAFDPRYFNPLMLAHNYYNYKEDTVLTPGDEANNLFGLSFDWVIIPGLKLGGQFALDQYQTAFEDKDALPQAAGYLLNLSYTMSAGKSNVITLWGEFVHTSEYLYCNTKYNDAQMTSPNYNYDYILGYKRRDWQASSASYTGYPEGPAATVYALGAEFDAQSIGLNVYGEISYTEKGSKGIYDPTLIPSDNKIKQKTLEISLSAEYELNKLVTFFGGASFRKIENYRNTAGDDRFVPQAYMGCTVRLRYEK